jgi:hypothetical protein
MIRKYIDDVFSRNMLGSVLVGASAGKIVEKSLNLYLSSTTGLLVGWTVAFLFFIVLFAYWNRIEAFTE